MRGWDPDTYSQRLALLLPACLLSTAWVFLLTARLRPGWQRLLAALPVVTLNSAAPLLFNHCLPPPAAGEPPPDSEILTIVLVEFALTWLSSFKVLAWAVNRGPLAAHDWRPLPFAVVQLAPITPVDGAGGRAAGGRGRGGEHAGGAGSMLLAFVVKAALVLALLPLLRLEPPELVLETLYTFGVYAILSFVMDGPAALASALIGMRVSPHFESPWLSVSLADFWSKRWDLAAGNSLRHLIYEPIVEGRLVAGATSPARSTRAAASKARQRRLVGAAAAFLVSGCMHELQFVYMTGHTSHGLMLLFFLAQVPLLLLERRLGVALRGAGVRVPAALKAVATLGTLLLLAHWTFWAGCFEYGITDASLASVQGSVDAAKQLLAGWRGRPS